MPKLNRREFTKIVGAAGAVAGTSALATPAIAQGKGKVVIIGGGIGGATVAHHVKKTGKEIDVVLITAEPTYTTCFFSNWYLADLRTFDSITHNYDGLKKMGVKVIVDTATGADTAKKTVSLKGGGSESYDKLVVSPGIDFKWDTIDGLDAKVAETITNAWHGGNQTKTLKKQLDAMKDGGVYIQCPPPNPFRCPPGPQERVMLIAHLFKTKKPKSKIVTLDPKPKFSKDGLFKEGAEKHYKGMITFNQSNDIDNFGIVSVDPSTLTVTTKGGDKHKADVLNIIPAQKAGAIAAAAGLTDGDWCPINPADFSSTKAKDVYVLGDASIAKKMPKSGFSANSQAKVVANAVLASLGVGKKFPAKFRNTCWSAISPSDGVKVGASYKAGDKLVEVTSKFISKKGEDAALRKKTFEEAVSWYDGIVSDTFAKG